MNGFRMYATDLPCPLIVLVGPTAAGKSSLAIALAQRVDGEIISADSCQFYRGMDIGTAKPSRDELNSVPHHLIDVTDPDHPWNLVVFQEEANRAIQEIHSRGRLPILVGGTGQYIRAVVEGWKPPEVKPDPRIRGILFGIAGEIGNAQLHHYLKLLDPPAAASIDPRNARRTIRALEVIFTSGRRFSSQRKKWISPYSSLVIGLQVSRVDLYNRIDARIDKMIMDGLVEEVRNLLASGYAMDITPFTAIGYREIISYLKGETTLDEAITMMRRNTRRFVRRQANWFPPDSPTIHWLEVETPDLLERALDIIQNRHAWNIRPSRTID